MDRLENMVTIVLAGSAEEYARYVRDNPSDEKRYVYGSSVYKLITARIREVVTCGTFWQRKDARKLFDVANDHII